MISKEKAGQMAQAKLFERLAKAAKAQNTKFAYFHAEPARAHTGKEVLNITLIAGPPQQTVCKYADFQGMIKDSVSAPEWLILKMPQGQEAMAYIQSALIQKIREAEADFAICRPTGVGEVGFFAAHHDKPDKMPISMQDFI